MDERRRRTAAHLHREVACRISHGDLEWRFAVGAGERGARLGVHDGRGRRSLRPEHALHDLHTGQRGALAPGDEVERHRDVHRVVRQVREPGREAGDASRVLEGAPPRHLGAQEAHAVAQLGAIVQPPRRRHERVARGREHPAAMQRLTPLDEVTDGAAERARAVGHVRPPENGALHAGRGARVPAHAVGHELRERAVGRVREPERHEQVVAQRLAQRLVRGFLDDATEQQVAGVVVQHLRTAREVERHAAHERQRRVHGRVGADERRHRPRLPRERRDPGGMPGELAHGRAAPRLGLAREPAPDGVVHAQHAALGQAQHFGDHELLGDRADPVDAVHARGDVELEVRLAVRPVHDRVAAADHQHGHARPLARRHLGGDDRVEGPRERGAVGGLTARDDRHREADGQRDGTANGVHGDASRRPCGRDRREGRARNPRGSA